MSVPQTALATSTRFPSSVKVLPLLSEAQGKLRAPQETYAEPDDVAAQPARVIETDAEVEENPQPGARYDATIQFPPDASVKEGDLIQHGARIYRVVALFDPHALGFIRIARCQRLERSEP